MSRPERQALCSVSAFCWSRWAPARATSSPASAAACPMRLVCSAVRRAVASTFRVDLSSWRGSAIFVLLHYLDCGDPAAPCVVLFHGNGSMIQDFTISGLVDRLARRNRVLCFDRPGFGYSQRPRSRIWTATAQAALFVKALNQLGVSNPVVLGHSWGALVGIAIGLRHDYPIRGLVLASGYYFPTWRWDVWIMSGPAIPLLGDLLRYTVAPIISWVILPTAFRKLFAPRSIPSKFKIGFPSSLTFRPNQFRAAAE